MANALLSTVNAARQRLPMCNDCERSLPNQIVFDKIETIIRLMQDEQSGLPVKTAKSFMSKIPSVFTGTDLIQWMMRNLKLEDQQEAIHLANLIASHGYIFPIEDHTLSIKNDCTFYRFQTPCLWPSNNCDPENTDYAVYLCKRTMQGKTRLELADYEAENLARLQKMFSRKWEFIFMQAESQAKVDKKRDKLERKVLDSQERAFWDVYRPVPGCVNTTELDIKKSCRLSKSAKRCPECQKVASGQGQNQPATGGSQLPSAPQVAISSQDSGTGSQTQSAEKKPSPSSGETGSAGSRASTVKVADPPAASCSSPPTSTSTGRQQTDAANSKLEGQSCPQQTEPQAAEVVKTTTTTSDSQQTAAAATSGDTEKREPEVATATEQAPSLGRTKSSERPAQATGATSASGHQHHQHKHHSHHHHHHHPHHGHAHSHHSHHHHRQCPHHKAHQLAREQAAREAAAGGKPAAADPKPEVAAAEGRRASGREKQLCGQLSMPAESLMTATAVASTAANWTNREPGDQQPATSGCGGAKKRSVGSAVEGSGHSRIGPPANAVANRRKSECNRMLSMTDSSQQPTLSAARDATATRPASACSSFAAGGEPSASGNQATISEQQKQQATAASETGDPQTRKGSLNVLRSSADDSRLLVASTSGAGSSSHSGAREAARKASVAASSGHQPLKATQSVAPADQLLHRQRQQQHQQNIGDLERELEALKVRLDRRVGGVKMSKVTQSYFGYFKQWAEYDPFIAQPIPSNPWVSDSTELWDSERQTKDVHCRRVRRWAFSLKELLNDPAGREQFHRFLEKEFSAENLKFWDAVQDLKRVASKDVARRVEAIWTEYLAQDAISPINIDSKSYETSKRNMAKNKDNRCIFDEAAGHVYQLMKNDSYPRYLRSDMYKDYKEASEKKRSNQVAFDVFKPQITTLKHKFNF